MGIRWESGGSWLIPHGRSWVMDRCYTYMGEMRASVACEILQLLDHVRITLIVNVFFYVELFSIFFRKTGTIYIDKYPFSDIEAREQSAIRNGLNYAMLSSSQVRQIFPGLIEVPEGQRGYYEKDTQTLKADKAMACLHVSKSFRSLSNMLQ